MQFSTVAAFAAVAAVASAQNITTETATESQTTLVTITSCEENKCSESVSEALVSTATVTVNDVITEYTTWCPLPTTEAPVEKNTTSTAAPAPSTSHTQPDYTGAAAKALPAAGALVAGAAALLL
ncbi:Ccw12p [Kluyveromyces lactis]|uniref:KLLA0F20031p n=1 Tax=Kluyveromyces lactis (strain ATCC 8585 / CBS 2359 / DSM 70799 / NBRC 1267 / NRRL Y-1140 / WM37) TaxID=284590 RepID=Q6CJA9_KLULA|nr:uncharacterized protein KLLA0_F20031g [Kluyveromyces lactis]CAG98688.1 KLLA0F20031p [Kluyveromyces lactis]|eukprot:XP_455980.1 uncharacterized protein KLLA0_F20031g [Kluyveromyces lactis]